jgi:two-component system phosphate regulon sensor histidine kinase PhoR
MSRSVPPQRSLFWQLAAALVLLHLLVALLVGWFGYTRVRDFHYEQTNAELDRLVQLKAPGYAAMLASGEMDAASIQHAAAQDGLKVDARLTLIAPDGRVLADSFHDPASMENHAGRPEIAQALAAETGSAIRRSSTLDQHMLYVARAMHADDGRVIGVLRMARPLDALHREIRSLMLAIATGAALVLVTTLALMLMVSYRLDQGMQRLTRGATRFAEGELDYRVPNSGSGALTDLADALNRMADQLNHRMTQIKAQHNEQQAIVQSMSSAVVALDLDQRILSVNRAAQAMLNLNGHDVRGRLLQEVLRQPQLNRFVMRAMTSPGEVDDELDLEGQVSATVEATSQPLRDGRDRQVGLLVLLNDVTRLRRLESVRSDFAANVSHELRTPITNIKGYVETMLDVGTAAPEQSARFLGIIKRNTDRLAAIIEDLLALARLEQPDMRSTLERRSMPVRRLVGAVVAQHEGEAQRKQIVIHTDIPAELTVNVSPHLVEQAISNLLSNAIKYSPSDTRVSIVARPSNVDEVSIAVSDQGPGIDARHLPRIFERFYRVDKARSRELGGTGLGLAIVKHIALVHGGRVEVESALGKGSVFTLILPG